MVSKSFDLVWRAYSDFSWCGLSWFSVWDLDINGVVEGPVVRWTSTVADASGMFEKSRSIVLLLDLRLAMVVASPGSFNR